MTNPVTGGGGTSEEGFDYEVIIVGAGITGIHQLYRMREAGFRVRLLEAGAGIGGTWYWNRYPQARFDSESYTYGYFFSQELLQEWNWSEHFAGQPETEAYLNFVVDRFGMREDIEVNARVAKAEFDPAAGVWTLATERGLVLRARFVIAAVGLLSAPYYPEVPGKNEFQGEAYHTGEWPQVPVDFAGKRVAVIGTGASGVQVIPPIAESAASLIVYQRTANWVVPLNNSPISAEEQRDIRSGSGAIRETLKSTFAGFLHEDSGRMTFDDSEVKRREFYEHLWGERGMAKLFSNYSDLMRSTAANEEFCKYLADKIREIVSDPSTADTLIPKDHGFGMKRPPMGSGYYETFNRSDVSLVDLRKTPIVRITGSGIETAERFDEIDVIVWATGFDAVTGSLTRIQFNGLHGHILKNFWAEGPRTYLGMLVPEFPNLLMAGGPHGTYGNVPRSTEDQVEFITGLLSFVRRHGYGVVETTETAEREWTDHVYSTAADMLVADSAWYMGSNIPGKAKRFLLYVGGLDVYREKITKVAEAGFPGIQFSAAGDSSP